MKNVTMFFSFIAELSCRRSIIVEMTKRDFKAVYLGSYLGMLWAFLVPIAMTLIFWFVFQIGYNAQPVEKYPYILWLVCGMFPWFFFNDSVNNGANSIISNAFIVKKMVFSIGILPIIKILSALLIHVFFIFLIFIMFLAYGYTPDIYSLQVIYYLFASILLVLGVSWLTAPVLIFFRDLRPIITIVLQIGFYLTPIFWNLNVMPESYRTVISYNPVYYIVQGYRDCFIHKIWFWEHLQASISFWIITLLTLVVGAVVFRRLRPHFADVL